MEKTLKKSDETIIDSVLTAATEVHRELGPGLLESVYEAALVMELRERGIKIKQQMEVPVEYKGQNLGVGYRADIVVEDSLLLELKSVKEIEAVHMAQVMSYLKLLKIKTGYILNFNKRLMKEGIKKISI